MHTIITCVKLAIAVIVLSLSLDLNAAHAKNGSSERVQVTQDRIWVQLNIPLYTYKIAKKHPHYGTSYTEGLVMSDGDLYEGTGLFTRSRLMKQKLKTGDILKERVLDSRYFGEGVTVMGDEIFQLSYESNTGFVYDKHNMAVKREFQYPWQGWGLTNDGQQLIMSNGSSALLFLDPATMKMGRYILVSDDKGSVGFLNELEYVDGSIYANVWQTDFIAIISPESGKITGWIDLTGLNPDPTKLKYPYVLNGIAYNQETRHLLVTGKCWPKVYEIELIPVKDRHKLGDILPD